MKTKRLIRLQLEALLAAATDLSTEATLFTRAEKPKRTDAHAPDSDESRVALAALVGIAEEARRRPLPLTDELYEGIDKLLDSPDGPPSATAIYRTVRSALAPKNQRAKGARRTHAADARHPAIVRAFGEANPVQALIDSGVVEVVERVRGALRTVRVSQ